MAPVGTMGGQGAFARIVGGRSAVPRIASDVTPTPYRGVDDYFFTQITAATAITLPLSVKPWHLIKVDVLGGAGAGDFDFLVEGGWHAKFPTGNGVQSSWDVDWLYPGNSVPAAIQTFEGDANPASVGLHFAKFPNRGAPPISAYRSVLVTDTEAGANTTQKTLTAKNFDIQPGMPERLLAFISAGNGQVFWQTLGGVQAGAQAIAATQPPPYPMHAAPPLPPLASVTPIITNSAAAHFTLYYFYKNAIAYRASV